MKFTTYKTERLLLRRLTPDDFVYVFEHFSDTEIKDFFGLTSDEEFIKELNKFESGYTTHNRSLETFQIIDKENNNIIGSCGYHNWYKDHQKAELGYIITNEVYKGMGVMSEAIKVVLEHGFVKMKLHRIEAMVGTENVASIKLLEKNGFVKEGILKENYLENDKYLDSIIYAKIKA